MENLSDAQVLLLAAQLVATPELSRFRLLAAKRRDVLSREITFRVLLTYLPLESDAEVDQELDHVLRDIEDDFRNFSNLDTPYTDNDLAVPNASHAERSLADLVLEKVPPYDEQSNADLLSDFLIAWAHKLEAFGGINPSVFALIDSHAARHPALQLWADTYLRPLHKLQNDLYPEEATTLSLTDLESCHGSAGVALLLAFSAHSGTPANVARDLDEVVTPWVRGARPSKRRKLNTTVDKEKVAAGTTWHDVDNWLLTTSRKDYNTAAVAVEQWEGPRAESSSSATDAQHVDSENMLAYIRTVIAIIYTSDEHDDGSRISIKKSLLQRAARLAQLMPPDFELPLPNIPDSSSLRNATRADLLDNTLLHRENIMTRPSTDVIDFLHGVLSTQSLLDNLKIDSTTCSVASLALFESEERQKQELRNILNQIPKLTRSNISWRHVREQLLWLHTWSSFASHELSQPTAYLGRVTTEYLELQILDAMLAANEYDSIKTIYLTPDQLPISIETVEKHVITAIYHAYDNASNGNRTRGGVKRASDILKSFLPSFPSSPVFTHIEHLIKATHNLSFYQLTLQHGVPFQPVSIRISSDPLSLIGKVLDQNNKAYVQLDDLLSIARNLVLADLPMPTTSQDFAPGEDVPLERRLFDAEHRITYLAITAALADHDFDTAYSLITTRLTISHTKSSTPFADDTSWRAAYAAGNYRPQHTPSNLHDRIALLQKQMDLLSTALTLAPTSEPLPEILSTWRRCEEEVDSLKAQALSEERALDAASDGVLPGGFGPSDRDLDANETKRLLESRRAYNATAPSYEEEAPMGLFDVARGAANALRKNAFPLRGAAGKGVQVRDQPRANMEADVRSSTDSERPGSSDGQRVRKRDMISNAVTGTVVGGLSWMLGTQPVDRKQQGHE
ncbi:hypothetical protein H2198_000522 [Neophaeococcomyces mojaviensis]|uniref:Uncharacterized protein n=1 Tax=Neophaeococcomyces mojaviensis TaxID=3383035 RepID=A0ACC3AK67_9EURO|nr:hypothetical protein H2198_000522 [Knufia sp. JES_112]